MFNPGLAVSRLAALACAFAIAGCAPEDIASRDAATLDIAARSTASPASELAVLDAVTSGALAAEDMRIARYRVSEVRIDVPRDLSVSEANVYYPLSDIVWRGEARGDRHAQVEGVLADAFALATKGMQAGPEVVVEVQLRRFHALTEKTRYSFGGVHSIRFDLTVRDKATGAVLEGPRRVVADVRAAGGQRAVNEEARGLTQRVVIVYNVAHTVLRELSEPVEDAPANMVLTRIDEDLRVGLSAVSMKNEQVAGHSGAGFSSSVRSRLAAHAE